ncbi:hypothetical protein BHE74_00056300 [Ensete ventricosum]|nr:hypothetical protein GW17_00002623 [Ensete ventricosum]RWW38466.1 hypothetical protein BHE74_00056300 [Ensete ventricosum]RZS26867.1 hypothetical protein BHM03_00060273 [Ensete ventricosum]
MCVSCIAAIIRFLYMHAELDLELAGVPAQQEASTPWRAVPSFWAMTCAHRIPTTATSGGGRKTVVVLHVYRCCCCGHNKRREPLDGFPRATQPPLRRTCPSPRVSPPR